MSSLAKALLVIVAVAAYLVGAAVIVSMVNDVIDMLWP